MGYSKSIRMSSFLSVTEPSLVYPPKQIIIVDNKVLDTVGKGDILDIEEMN